MHASNADLLHKADLTALGARVRAARLAKGWTQTQLAGEEISVGYVSRIESGARRPNLAVLTNLAARLGTPVEQLLQGVTASQYDEIRLGLDYAELALESGEGVEAEQQAREQLAVAEEALLTELAHRARYLLARALEANGDLDAAIIELERLVESASDGTLITAGIALSRCYRETGDLALAIEVGDRLEPRIDAAGLSASDESVQLAVTVAGAHIMRGDLHKAARICAEAVRRADEISSPRARAGAYWNASIVHKRRGDVATAAPLASRALAILTEGSDARNLARLRAQLGDLQLHMDPPALDEALTNLTRARTEMHDSSASEVDVARLDVSIAESHLLAGDPELALSITAEVRARGLEGASLLHTEALVVEGQALTALGRADEGHAAYVQALHSLTASGADRAVAQLWFELAELLERAGDLDGAREAYRSAAATSGLTARQRSEKQVPSSL